MEEGWIEVQHMRVGAFRVREGDLLRFPGLPGFPDACRFALLRHDERGPSEQPFSWLACVDDDELAFAVTDPRAFAPDYDPDLPPGVLAELDAAERESLTILTIANLATEPPRLNLAAPLVLNLDNRRGAQVILENAFQPASEEASSATQIESNPQR